jgi:hypothetical protein
MKFLFSLVCALISVGISSAYGYGEVSTSGFKIVNSLGEDIKSPVVDQQLNLQTSLQNTSENNTNWVYIVQIINSEGAIMDLNYVKGSLAKNQTLTAAVFWTAQTSGTYTIETFVWDNLVDIDPLTPMSSHVITVT